MRKIRHDPKSFRSGPRRRSLALAVAVGCTAAIGGAGAQVLVTDPGSITANEQGFASQLAKTVEQYAKQVQQYETQLQQYQQMLSGIQNLDNGLSLAPNQLQRVSNAAALIRGKCSGTAGPTDPVSSVMNGTDLLLTQTITQAQRALCGQIVLMQIDKYNTAVDMLDRLGDYGSQFRQVEDMARSIGTLADSGRVAAQVDKYRSAMATEMGNWQARMEADDAVIEILRSQQSILGHMALKGGNTVPGNVVQAAAFAAAFQ